jgi:hypothetical protein
MLVASSLSSGRAQHSPVLIEYYSGIIAIGQHNGFENVLSRLPRRSTPPGKVANPSESAMWGDCPGRRFPDNLQGV